MMKMVLTCRWASICKVKGQGQNFMVVVTWQTGCHFCINVISHKHLFFEKICKMFAISCFLGIIPKTICTYRIWTNPILLICLKTLISQTIMWIAPWWYHSVNASTVILMPWTDTRNKFPKLSCYYIIAGIIKSDDS
jgi:hypothetical protein